jgi:hypothetical protein
MRLRDRHLAGNGGHRLGLADVAVAAGERPCDRFGTGVVTVTQGRQGLRIALGSKDRADYARAARAGDVAELTTWWSLRPARADARRIAAPQSVLWAKAEPQESKRMEPLQLLHLADIGLAPGTCLAVTRRQTNSKPPWPGASVRRMKVGARGLALPCPSSATWFVVVTRRYLAG